METVFDGCGQGMCAIKKPHEGQMNNRSCMCEKQALRAFIRELKSECTTLRDELQAANDRYARKTGECVRLEMDNKALKGIMISIGKDIGLKWTPEKWREYFGLKAKALGATRGKP